jgi:Trk K+ transport system NAD-binding subunit
VENPSPQSFHVPAPRSGAQPHTDGGRKFVICGGSSLAFRLAEELTLRYNANVTVILPDATSYRGPRISQLPHVRVIISPDFDVHAFREAGLTTADAVALVAGDDLANVRAAMIAEQVCPGVRIVLRLFNPTLASSIGRLFTDAQILSDTAIAAPAFVSAALGVEEPIAVRVAGRRVRATVAGDGETVLCGLAVTGRGAPPILLPEDDEQPDLVLALDEPEPDTPAEVIIRARRANLRRVWHNVRHAVRGTQLVSRGLRWTLIVMVCVVFSGIVAFTLLDRHVTTWYDLYSMLFTAVGAGQADNTLSGAQQTIQLIVTVFGVATIPLLSAAIVQASVHARLALGSGVLAAPEHGHVVVVGLGNVGTRILRTLHELGVEVVAIDHAENPLGAQFVREHRIAFIQGDASREGTLARANLHGALALVVTTSDDVTNLEYALMGRALRAQLRVVLRLFGGDFADRVKDVFDIQISRSVSALAAPAFAAAMVGREVIGTIPISRRMLLVAELPVLDGSWLSSARLADIGEREEARPVAVIGLDGQPEWRPAPDRALVAGEALVVVATRAGLSRIIGQSAVSSRVA